MDRETAFIVRERRKRIAWVVAILLFLILLIALPLYNSHIEELERIEKTKRMAAEKERIAEEAARDIAYAEKKYKEEIARRAAEAERDRAAWLAEAGVKLKAKEYLDAGYLLDRIIDAHPGTPEAASALKLFEAARRKIEAARKREKARARRKKLKEEAALKREELKKKRRRKKALSRMRVTETDWGVKCYQDKSSPRSPSRFAFFLKFCITADGDVESPRLTAYYRVSSNVYSMYVNGMSLMIGGDYYDFEDGGVMQLNGRQYEGMANLVRSHNRFLINKIIDSKRAKVLFNGMQGYNQVTDKRRITSTQRRALRNVLLAREALGDQE